MTRLVSTLCGDEDETVLGATPGVLGSKAAAAGAAV